MPTEAELVPLAIRRDTEAFGQLYHLYLDRIYRFIYYKVGNARDAEDLTERVFLKAWEAIDRYEPQGYPFSAWLYRLAQNTIIDHYRVVRRSGQLDENLTIDSDGLSPEEALEKKTEVKKLSAAIAELPEEQQQVIILRFIEGLPHAEVATIIGKSEGASRVLQHRALSRLHRILEEE